MPPIRQSRVVLIVPALAVLLTEVAIPSRSQQRLLQALPFALEEQLSQDIEQMHFALLGSEAAQQQVAVVQRSEMARWLAQAADRGIEPYKVIPELLLLPWQVGQWSLVVAGEELWLRTGRCSGSLLPLAHARLLLEEFIGALPEEQRPQQLQIYGELAESESLPLEVVSQPLPSGGLMALLAEGVVRQSLPQRDLQQGEFARQSSWGRYLEPWRSAAGVAVVLLLASLVEVALEQQRLSQQAEQLTQQIEQIYRSVFPEAKKVVNPRLQMERKLAELKKPQQQADLILLMQRALPLIAASPKSQVMVLRYKQGSLEIDLNLADLPALDRLKQQMAAQQLEMVVQNATSVRDQVSGRIMITQAK